MSDRLLVSLAEAVEIAKGNEPAARIRWNGHDYVPATTITALQERVKELEGALKPFAVLARLFDEDMISGNMPARGSIYEWSRLIDGQEVNYTLTVEHLKSARTALGEKQ